MAIAAVSTKPVVVKDAAGDAATGALDVTRVQLGRSADGRLRGVITTSGPWRTGDLVARDGGPPGSLCLRLYTAAGTVEGAVPTHLACVSADRAGRRLRGVVLRERPNALPERSGTAVVSRASTRSVVLRFSQSAIGRPATVRFAAESLRAGCIRTSCVDAAPDGQKVGTLKLREPEATTNRP